MIKIVRKPSYLRTLIDREKCKGRKIGFVPTMGNLHEGHISLIKRSVKQCDITVASIFVNPIQFGENEDLDAYPRTFLQDKRKLLDAGCNIIFYPDEDIMYRDRKTNIHVSGITEGLCGASRPGHFDGVTTVVAKLFNIVNPHYAYFGEKDYQQLLTIRKMTYDLDMPVKIIGCPIIREEDGLAMSSRNSYLSSQERTDASQIYSALKKGAISIKQGKSTASVKRGIRKVIQCIHNARIDYIEILDSVTLKKPDNHTEQLRIVAAVFIGKTRLIDNIGVNVK